MERVLQLNLDGTGGAFSLMYQVQQTLNGRIIFDYYTMGRFKNKNAYNHIKKLNGKVIEGNLRKNRLVGHFLLPFDFYRLLKKSNYKTVHIHADTAWKLALYAVPSKIAGVDKVIVHAHSSEINGDHRLFKYFCHTVAKPFLPKWANIYLSCSDLATKWIYPLKYQEKVRLIINGVDCQKFAFSEKERIRIRNELNLPDNVVLVGMVGDMSYPKNPEFILDVMEKLHKISSSYYLLFLGDGIDRLAVEKAVSEKEYRKNIIFYGRTNEVASVLSAMDIYVMPSRFEGLPVSGVEAQVNGLPSIISDKITKNIKILEECYFLGIERNDIGKWVEIIEKMKIDIMHRNKAVDIANQKRFNIKKTANDLIEIYENG